MSNIELLIGQSSTEGERKRQARLALQAELPTKWQHYIDRLSEYMASTGKKYQSHLATIRRWAEDDGKKCGIPDYSREEGESLWAMT